MGFIMNLVVDRLWLIDKRIKVSKNSFIQSVMLSILLDHFTLLLSLISFLGLCSIWSYYLAGTVYYDFTGIGVCLMSFND